MLSDMAKCLPKEAINMPMIHTSRTSPTLQWLTTRSYKAIVHGLIEYIVVLYYLLLQTAKALSINARHAPSSSLATEAPCISRNEGSLHFVSRTSS